jgi:hypothetical protein
MKLGLIGTGKQGQRYLLEKNGGAHIKVSGSRRIPLDDVDGVIIATHPAAHKELALEAIVAGKHVLVEKPLALNLRDCMEIIDAAEKADVTFDVAHTYLWSREWAPHADHSTVAVIRYEKHNRDYSAWLDWAPHGIALLADACSTASEQTLRNSVCMIPGEKGGITVHGLGWYFMPGDEPWPPMFSMTRAFRLGKMRPYDFNRRVYRALFSEE